jgi:hypothetical protein
LQKKFAQIELAVQSTSSRKGISEDNYWAAGVSQYHQNGMLSTEAPAEPHWRMWWCFIWAGSS